jgi:hypothetical protein
MLVFDLLLRDDYPDIPGISGSAEPSPGRILLTSGSLGAGSWELEGMVIWCSERAGTYQRLDAAGGECRPRAESGVPLCHELSGSALFGMGPRRMVDNGPRTPARRLGAARCCSWPVRCGGLVAPAVVALVSPYSINAQERGERRHR